MVPGPQRAAPSPPDPPRDGDGRPARAALQRVLTLCGSAMRGAEGLAAAAAALLGAVPPISLAWVLPAVAIDLVWSALFVRVLLRHGPLIWPVLGEVAVTGGFGIAQGRLVVPEAAGGGASWIAVLTTMTIVVAGLCWPPRIAVPAGLAVTGAHLAGARLAGLPSGPATAGIHLIQIAAMAVLMTLLRRSAAVADLALGELRRAATDRPYVTPTMAHALSADARPQRPQLSEREHLALLLWFQSMSKASVARRMGISEATVRQYIDRARVKYARIGRPAPSKAALLARAIEDGLIRPDEVGTYRSFAAGDRVPPDTSASPGARP